MTVDEINGKIQALNSRLDNYITDLQFSGGVIDEVELQKRVDSIQRVILQDSTVVAVLTGSDDRERANYITAIGNGLQETRKLLEQFKNSEIEANKIDIISNVQKNANKDLVGVQEGIIDVFNNTSDMALKDDERMQDLEKKINIFENGLAYSERVEKIKELLDKEGRDPSIAEAVNEVSAVKKELEKANKSFADINTVKNNNLIEKIKEYEELIGRGYLISDDNVQNVIKDMRKLAIDIDRIDNLDSADTNKVNASDSIPKTKDDCEDAMIVAIWVNSLKTKAADDDFAKKLSLDDEFVEARTNTIKSEFSKVIKASTVLRNFDSAKFENVKDFDCGYDDVKNYIDEALEGIKACKAVEGKEPSEVKRYVNDAKKLYDSYKTIKTNPNQVTFNGKTKIISGTGVDMTDVNMASFAVSEIRRLNNSDEFKVEFDNKVKEEVEKALMAVPKPSYGRFRGFLYGLRKLVTFGRVLTPKEKYEMIYEETKSNKEIEVTKEIIGENKNKRDNAKSEVSNDKDLYHKVAIQKVMELKQKLNAKKHKNQIIQKRDKSEPLSR